MNNLMMEKLIRFQHPERALAFARGLTDETLAGIFGTDPETYRATLSDIEEERASAVSALAADPDVQHDLRRVPFAHANHIVAVGESTTADRMSWFEILAALLYAERPDLDLRFDNLAVSGATTTQMLAGVSNVRRQEADWIFCMLGNNDAQRFGSPDGARLVTRDETARNLREIRNRSLDDQGEWVWVVPTPVDEARVAAFPFFGAAGITWTNADAAYLADLYSEMDDLVIATSEAVVETGEQAFMDDGVHPTLATHARIAASVLAALAERGDR